ncbi:MAG: DEAD/DEAH box helicase family protein, partial [Clostridia bacterium]|nr:DEAD/DEAH box helicase family protein [Clostridia bacterium]
VLHPKMVLGEMVMESGPFGPQSTCKPFDGQPLSELLSEAIENIHAEINEIQSEDGIDYETDDDTIPADPNVRNFSYTLVSGKIYYRENSIMKPVETSVTGENRIKGMISLRDAARELIDAQLDNADDAQVQSLQSKLSSLYDRFTYKYGLINSRGNAMVFDDDNSYFLLCSLEILDEEGNLQRKADIFSKRTINPILKADKADTASEALAVSLSERANVDLPYMASLLGEAEDVPKIVEELRGVIFKEPTSGAFDFDTGGDHWKNGWQTADEYLSGNVREKLRQAKAKAESDSFFKSNVEALEKVQPQDLTAAEIGVRLGSTWVPPEDVQTFLYELLGTPYYYKYRIQVKYEPITGQWSITDKTYDRFNVKASSVYGTSRINAYNIVEDSLNLKDVRVFDYLEDESGKKKPVLNKKETTIAQGKQEEIKRQFEEWIWKDPERRERLCRLYNEKFNSTRPREYNGQHIRFYGMSPEITLREHQVNAVARILYGGNTLLAHVVGAGKTFTMVAAAQEEKRIGLCSKSMFVVPNHLISQWASEYLQLYPSANILVATRKDFETKNRKKFCARIATGAYDVIILGHSQFEKIPISVDRQVQMIQSEIDEILESIEKIKYERGERFTIKQLEKTKKQLQLKLDKLTDRSRKDDVVTFEQLGVDRLFIDEAHFYKNLAAFTKMRNVAGISQTEAQKSSDLYMKCRYLDEITGGKGVTFATGTPISNTMVEMYTMQKYLQYDALKEQGLSN